MILLCVHLVFFLIFLQSAVSLFRDGTSHVCERRVQDKIPARPLVNILRAAFVYKGRIRPMRAYRLYANAIFINDKHCTG